MSEIGETRFPYKQDDQTVILLAAALRKHLNGQMTLTFEEIAALNRDKPSIHLTQVPEGVRLTLAKVRS